MDRWNGFDSFSRSSNAGSRNRGGQLYKMELPGSHGNQKLTPKITDSAKALWKIYVGLTLLCATLYVFWDEFI